MSQTALKSSKNRKVILSVHEVEPPTIWELFTTLGVAIKRQESSGKDTSLTLIMVADGVPSTTYGSTEGRSATPILITVGREKKAVTINQDVSRKVSLNSKVVPNPKMKQVSLVG